MAIILRMHSLRHMTFPLFVRSCFTLSLTYPSDWFSSFISMPPLRLRCVYSSENNYRWLRESLEVLPFPSWILTLGFLCTRSSSGIRGITFISVLLRSWQGRVAPPTFRVSPGCNFPWPAHDSSLTNGVGTEVKGFATAKHKRENPNYLQRRRSAAVSRRLYLCNNRAADHDFSFSFFFITNPIDCAEVSSWETFLLSSGEGNHCYLRGASLPDIRCLTIGGSRGYCGRSAFLMAHKLSSCFVLSKTNFFRKNI